ncbi:MAG: SsrA-binding protein SmpB [Candidatus Omnitrophica bacterium]|nr:SsrA-binding protein SmpB [Candidatus Omnitrophota bacterium]
MGSTQVTNRKARRDYDILDSLECGIELKGGEVKSLRRGRMNIDDSFARIEKGEVILFNAHISPYEEASYLNVEPKRPRRLLLHKKQIKKLTGNLTQRGLTLVPLKVYFNVRGYAKVELGVGRGKKLYDKRDDVKRRELDRALHRALRRRHRG